jgi:general stress protein 26
MDTEKHLYELIKDFRTAMVVTHAQDGSCHARPMAVAEIKPGADAHFATTIDSPKIAEIEADSRILITFQSSSEFATLEGTATIVRDRILIDRLWSEAWRVWYPKGKDDPSLRLLKVSVEQGEYWDGSGIEGIKYMFEGMKAIFQGRRPEMDSSQHSKVKL